MKTTVALTPCPNYQIDELSRAIRACFDALGGTGAWIKPGDRVLCKINQLMPASPERAITTHPELLRAVVRTIRDAGGTPLVGDNPAALGQNIVMRRTGIHAILDEEHVELADMSTTIRIENPTSRYYHHFEVSRACLEADLLLNLPKLKTHALAYMTLAVKNYFGLIPGLEKARWHVRAQSAEQFSAFLVDLYGAVLHHRESTGRKGRLLNLLDGVLALEGEGPGMGGVPRHVGVVMLSADAVALDRAACHLVDVDPDRLLTCRLAGEAGLGVADLDQIEMVGGDIESLRVRDFVPPKVASKADSWPMSAPFFRNRIIERPVVSPATCTGCARCQQICPAAAIHVDKDRKLAVIDYKPCIRCYCCCEVCPEGSMHRSDPPVLGRVMGSRTAMVGISIALLLSFVGAVLAIAL
jgi:uncharacterized protein (DUF362 family)/Pyruvate/2-oxoacid:ferredoxin oxidoreductase delta subunit